MNTCASITYTTHTCAYVPQCILLAAYTHIHTAHIQPAHTQTFLSHTHLSYRMHTCIHMCMYHTYAHQCTVHTCGYHMCIHMHKYHTITHMHTHAYTQRTHVCMWTLQACMLTYRSHTYTDYMSANVQTHTCAQLHTDHAHTYPYLLNEETNFSPLSPASTLQCVFLRCAVNGEQR